MSTATSQTAAANQARRKRTEDKLRAVADAIQQMQRRRLPVTYPAIASRAGVSRTFLYDNPAARDLVSAAITRADSRRQHDTAADRDAQAEASWQQRALNAEQALKTAHAEIRAQRARIGELLGQLRDTQREHDSDALQRLTAENTTLRQRSATSPPSSAPWKNACKPPAPTTASSTSASPASKRSCWPRSREPDAGRRYPADRLTCREPPPPPTPASVAGIRRARPTHSARPWDLQTGRSGALMPN